MLRFRHRLTRRNLPKAQGPGSGPQGRINKMKMLVTALVRHERIEGKWDWLDESRGYAERLIQEASMHGDTHKPTMEIADFWLLEKDLIPKLFKVLAPRFKSLPSAATSMYKLPTVYPGEPKRMGILELKGNPYPPVLPKTRDIRGSLVNVLLDEARRDYNKTQKRSPPTASDTPQAEPPETSTSEQESKPDQSEQNASIS